MARNPDEISLNPLRRDISRCTPSTLKQDFVSGLAVALLSLPQALAYSIVAGLPPSAGIFATIFGTITAALLGSSRQLVIGPNNASVLLLQSATADILYRYYPFLDDSDRMLVTIEIMAALTLIIGLTQMSAAFFRLGRIVQFVSLSVVVGYVAGSAFAIAIDQLYTITGIRPPTDPYSLYEKIQFIILHLGRVHWITLGVGLVSLFCLKTLKRLNLNIPVSILMVVAVTVFASIFELSSYHDTRGRALQLIGETELGGAFFTARPPLFEFRLLSTLMPYAFAIAFIGMLETHSIGKSIAANTGQHLQTGQELFALGCSNFLMSFFGALPCSGSISRSALNYESGAKTRFAAVFSGIIVWIMAWFLWPLMQYIPLATLAALLLATCIRMIDFRQLKLCMRTTHSDELVLVVTFLSCVFLSLQVAFYIGIMLSIVLYLRKAATPRVMEYVYDPVAYELKPVLNHVNNGSNNSPNSSHRPVRIINVEGELFFGAVDLFQFALREIAEDDVSTKVIILRLKHVRDLDASAALALKQLHDYLRKYNRHLIVASFPHPVYEVLESSGLTKILGKDNLIPIDEEAPYLSVERALARAQVLIEEDKLHIPQSDVAEDDLAPLAPEHPQPTNLSSKS